MKNKTPACQWLLAAVGDDGRCVDGIGRGWDGEGRRKELETKWSVYQENILLTFCDDLAGQI